MFQGVKPFERERWLAILACDEAGDVTRSESAFTHYSRFVAQGSAKGMEMTTSADRQRIEEALISPDPAAALHILARELKAEGMGQVAMYRLFAEYQRKTASDVEHSMMLSSTRWM